MSHSDPALANPPTLSALAVSGISGGSATVTWTSSQAMSSQVKYGVAPKMDQVTAETDMSPLVTSHSVTLSGLKAGKTYIFTANSRLNSGKDGMNNVVMNGHVFSLAGTFVAA